MPVGRSSGRPNGNSIAGLPSEIIIYIFSLCTEPHTKLASWSPPPAELIAFTHVCRRWRDIALNSPTLWHNICHAPWGKTSTAEALARAQLAPIDVVVHPRATARQRELVLQHLGHTRTLVLHDSDPSAALAAGVHAFYQRLTAPAPLLEVLDMRYTPSSPPIWATLPDGVFAGRATNLRRVKLGNVVGFPAVLPPLGGLTQLEIVFDAGGPPPVPALGAVLEALRQMPNLEDLCLEHHAVPTAVGSVPPPVALPLLKRLKLVGDVRRCATFIQCLQLPRLVKLDIDLLCPTAAASAVFLPILSAHFGPDNSAFKEVDLRTLSGGGLLVRRVRAWHENAGKMGAADVAVQFTTRASFRHPAAYNAHLRALFQALPALAAAEVMHIDETNWTPEEWIGVLGAARSLRTLHTGGAVASLCAALAMSIAAAGDTDWRICGTPGARVFCCPHLELVSVVHQVHRGPPGRTVSIPSEMPAAFMRAREAGGQKVPEIMRVCSRLH